MTCAKCGAQLRPSARFCNVCGTRTAGAEDYTTPPPASRRRVSRTMPLDDDAGLAVSPSTALLADESPQHQSAPASNSPLLPEQYAPGAEPASIPSFGGEDALPWPLPGGIIVDGRYRVEQVEASTEESNTYTVTDLRGYERCWACGTSYGAAAASERFCRECGADMLGRLLMMREWRAVTSETDAGPGDASEDGARAFEQGGRAYRVEPRAVAVSAFPLGARLMAGAASDLGRRRSGEHNEDSAFVLVLDRVHEGHTLPFGVFVVADGLGGHASGHRASRLIVNVLAHTILRQVALPVVGMPVDSPVDESELAAILRDAVEAANSSLCAANRENDTDAGSTVVAALIYGDTAYIANVGDSRAYLHDDTGLRRLTSDHSLVQQLVSAGMIQPDEVYTHPQRNQIFRSLGDEPNVNVDLYVQQLKPGTSLLLCSDGLWEMVRDPEIEAVLREETDPQSACDALIVAANEGGGDDNVTAVIVVAR
jgi:serine/threonine protein phosphatase PrpC